MAVSSRVTKSDRVKDQRDNLLKLLARRRGSKFILVKIESTGRSDEGQPSIRWQ